MKFCAAALAMVGVALADTVYQKPSPDILNVLNAPPPPQASVNPTRTHLLLLQGVRYPPIAELARPMLRLAGVRIDPHTNGPHTAQFYVSATLKNLATGTETRLPMPSDPKLSALRWSADGKRFAVLNTVLGRGIELWLGETETGALRKADGIVVNAVLGEAVQWLSDNKSLLVHTVRADRGTLPPEAAVPAGPIIQETQAGRRAPVRTFQDLLTSPRDEMVFEYYATSQLVLYDTASSQKRNVGAPALYLDAEASPDARYLLVSRVAKPFSYLHPVNYFPQDVEVWDLNGRMVRSVAHLPLAEIPIEGVRTGPRSIRWRQNEPSMLLWAEALDGGNPKEKVPHRDRLLLQNAPFQEEPREAARVEHRLTAVLFGPTGGNVLLGDYERDRKWVRTFQIDLDQPGSVPKQIFSRSIQDRYRDPGIPLQRMQPNGEYVLQQDGDWIFLAGNGSSPQGDRPFLDRYNLKTGQTERLFQSDASQYESAIAVLDEHGQRLLTQRESPTEPPNVYIRDLAAKTTVAITKYDDPAPLVRRIQKQRVTYQRPDGVPLSFTLYLPPDYKKGTALPTVVWAYPLEFNDVDTAGQIVGSTQRFTSLLGPTHLFFLLKGYAVLDAASMPVVGTPDVVNNTYLEQIVASAKAAIDKAAEMGVTDRNRVGVGGHSYGAFMTANLLAHSELFRAGIARSGAYNRTLTPFGFQSERRTIWEAPETYLRMSPFLQAHKIKEPILLIHGEADNNQGTFPIQSDRMYQAVRGNGGVARYVVLPHEAHGYAARESIEHTLYEMLSWFEQHVKNAPPLPTASEASGSQD